MGYSTLVSDPLDVSSVPATLASSSVRSSPTSATDTLDWLVGVREFMLPFKPNNRGEWSKSEGDNDGGRPSSKNLKLRLSGRYD